jgi:hypothetical protein
MHLKNTKLLLVLIATSVFLFSVAACTLFQSGQNSNIDPSESLEVTMDPSFEHDVQMIMDTLAYEDFYKKYVARGVQSLRSVSDIGAFVTIEIVADEQLTDFERGRLAQGFLYVDITDDVGVCYRVELNSVGLISGYGTSGSISSGIAYDSSAYK